MSIYQPAEDSYLMSEVLKQKLPSLLKKNSEMKFLEIGIGYGIQLMTARDLGVKNILGVDINTEAVKHCKNLGFKTIKSDLFEKIKGKFNVIIFNPPYLPENPDEPKDSSIATTGGKNGSEIINKFLKQAEKYLEKNSNIFLLVSNLTKGIKWGNWKKKKITEKNLFFEKIQVYELRQ